MGIVSLHHNHGKMCAGATMQVGVHTEPVVSLIIDVQYVISTDTGCIFVEKLISEVTSQMVIAIMTTMDQEVREEKVGQTAIIIITTTIKVMDMELRKKRNTTTITIKIKQTEYYLK